jgi:hypothetical protein
MASFSWTLSLVYDTYTDVFMSAQLGVSRVASPKLAGSHRQMQRE